MLGEGFGEMQNRENTEMVVDFTGGVGPTAVGFGGDVQRPAVDDAGKVTFVFEVSCDQLVELFGLLRIQEVTTVDLRQRADGLAQHRPDAVAAAAKLVRQCCPDAVAVEENRARTGCPLTSLPRPIVRHLGACDPFDLVEALVDPFGRHAR